MQARDRHAWSEPTVLATVLVHAQQHCVCLFIEWIIIILLTDMFFHVDSEPAVRWLNYY